MRERRVRIWDVLFFAVFAAYASGGLAVLVQGAFAAIASASPGLHEELHLRALGSGYLARVADRVAESSHDITSATQVGFDYAFSVLNLVLAGFVLWLRPRDRSARLLALALVGAAGVFNLVAQRTMEELPMLPWEAAAQGLAHVTAGLAYVYALLLFPDGRPVPRWRPWALALLYLPITVAALGVTLATEGTARPAVLIVFFGLLTPLVGVVAQAYRFGRSATAAQHQQARLLFWALLPALGLGVVFLGTGQIQPVPEAELAGRHLPELPVVAFRVFQPVFAIIPLALFAGILRYRLWDVDRVITRTLVYGAVTAVLVGFYFGGVVLLQRVFSPVTANSDLAVAASTLAVAAAARPLVRRVQGFVDRRFYRQRYDATKTIEAFSARLRDEIDLDSLAGALRTVVGETMQPASVSMWLREDDGSLSWSWTQRRDTASRNGPVTRTG